MGKTLKTGLLGYGTIAGAHIGGYNTLSAEGIVNVEAVCDIRSERLEGLKYRTYTDIDSFLTSEKGKLDYVDICLPTYLHAEVACKAMEKGFNVLCEKPMALSTDQCDKMIETSKRTGKTLMIAQCCRFTGMMKLIRSYIADGTMGKVRFAEFFREGGGTGPSGYMNWFKQEHLSGGAILDLHIHDVDMLLWLLGTPDYVASSGMNIIPGAGIDSLSTNYTYVDKYARIFCDWTIAHDKFNVRAYRINFEKGYIYCETTGGRQACVSVGIDGTVTDLSEHNRGNMYCEEIRYYCGCIADGKPVDMCPPEDSSRAVAVALREKESIHTKSTISLKGIN